MPITATNPVIGRLTGTGAPNQKKTGASRKVPTPAIVPPGSSGEVSEGKGALQSASVGGQEKATARMISTELFERSPWNRDTRNPDKFAQLVASVQEHGVIQPVIARPRPRNKPGFELVAGEGRWLAAKQAGLMTIPALIMELDDRQALELQAIENLIREDLSPIDEARKYFQLLDQPGYTMEMLVNALGGETKKSTIYARLALLKLPFETINALDDGTLPVSHAGLLGKLEIPAIIREAMQMILKPAKHDEKEESGILSFRTAKQRVEGLVQKQANELLWMKLKDKHEREGLAVLNAKENAAVFQWQTEVKSERPFINLDGWCRNQEGVNWSDSKQWRTLLPDAEKKLLPTLARTKEGVPVLLYCKTAVLNLAKESGIKLVSNNTPSGLTDKEKAARLREKEAARLFLEQQSAVFETACARVFQKVDSGEATDAFLRMIAAPFTSGYWENDPAVSVECAITAGIKVPESGAHAGDVGDSERLELAVKTATNRQMRNFLARVALSEFRPRKYLSEEAWATFGRVCGGFGVDVVEIADGMAAKPKPKKKAA